MDTADHSGNAFLRRCAGAYDAVRARALQLEMRGDDEAALRWIRLAASIAWVAHPGRFSDERLEAAGLRVGQRLQSRDPMREVASARTSGGPNSRRRVLHVATAIYEVGGHTRLIENWIKKDDVAAHSLILLDQQDHRIRDQTIGLVAASGGELMVVPAERPLLDKARRLREVAQAGNYDFIVLHHHPNDVVPLVALATTDCPPVAIMNHADHVFWLGVSVADAVIDFREFGARMSRERRGVRHSLMFPLPLEVKRQPGGRSEARAALGVAPDETVLLTIGYAYKYKPTKTHDYFRTLHRVLAANPAAHLYVVGIHADELPSFGVSSHDRIRLLGPVSDPSVYQAAADLYLEGFPLNSYTALLETSARGVCPVLMYAPAPQVDLSQDAALKCLVSSADDEDDYVARVTRLIVDPATRSRIGGEVAQRIAAIHGGDIGRVYLQQVYDRLGGTRHRPELPAAQGSAECEEDIDLANFNSSQDITTVMSRGVADTLDRLTIADVLRAWVMSIRVGDTHLTPSHVRSWLSVLRRKAFARQPTIHASR